MIAPSARASAEPALTLYADGGTIGGSPGRAVYWSVVEEEAGLERRHTDDSGRRKWSDEAEFLALVEALKLSLREARMNDVVKIMMDCRPVVQHVVTRHVPRCERLQALYHQVIDLLTRLARRGVEVALEWVQRQEVVRVVGH